MGVSVGVGGKGLVYAWVIVASVAALLLAIAVGLVTAAVWTMADSRLLAREGIPIEAQVVDRRAEQRRERGANGIWRTYTSYFVTVSYQPEGSSRIEVEESVSRGRYDVIREGSRITLIYAPSQPEVFEFTAGDRAGEGWLMKLAGLVMALLAAGAGGAAWYLRRIALMVRGALERRQAG